MGKKKQTAFYVLSSYQALDQYYTREIQCKTYAIINFLVATLKKKVKSILIYLLKSKILLTEYILYLKICENSYF